MSMSFTATVVRPSGASNSYTPATRSFFRSGTADGGGCPPPDRFTQSYSMRRATVRARGGRARRYRGKTRPRVGGQRSIAQTAFTGLIQRTIEIARLYAPGEGVPHEWFVVRDAVSEPPQVVAQHMDGFPVHTRGSVRERRCELPLPNAFVVASRQHGYPEPVGLGRDEVAGRYPTDLKLAFEFSTRIEERAPVPGRKSTEETHPSRASERRKHGSMRH